MLSQNVKILLYTETGTRESCSKKVRKGRLLKFMTFYLFFRMRYRFVCVFSLFILEKASIFLSENFLLAVTLCFVGFPGAFCLCTCKKTGSAHLDTIGSIVSLHWQKNNRNTRRVDKKSLLRLQRFCKLQLFGVRNFERRNPLFAKETF